MNPNSYCRDPWVRTFINVETDTFLAYPYEYLALMNPCVSLSHFEKGDAQHKNHSTTILGLNIYVEIYRYFGLASL